MHRTSNTLGRWFVTIIFGALALGGPGFHFLVPGAHPGQEVSVCAQVSSVCSHGASAAQPARNTAPSVTSALHCRAHGECSVCHYYSQGQTVAEYVRSAAHLALHARIVPVDTGLPGDPSLFTHRARGPPAIG